MASSELFDALIKSENLAADAALVAALEDATPEECAPIVSALLRRNRPDGLAGLVERYDRLDDTQRERIVAAADQLYGALRTACSAEDVQVRLNVITIILESGRYRLTYLISGLLRDGVPRVREAAARALQTMVDRFLTEEAARSEAIEEEPPAPARRDAILAEQRSRAEDRRRLGEAVLAGLQSFKEHLHPPVVETALWLVDDLGGPLWSELMSPGSHSRRAAIDILHRPMVPRLVPFAMESLAVSDFRPAVIRALSGHLTDEVLEEWARQSWRMEVESVGRGMRAVKVWRGFVGMLGPRFSSHMELMPLAIRLLLRTGLATDAKVGLLKRALGRADRSTRRAAVWALCELDTVEASSVLRSVADSDDAALAAVARRELKRRLYEQSDALAPGAEAWVSDLERYWASFESLSADDRKMQGQAILSRPYEFEQFAHDKLESPSPATRVKALRMLTLTGFVEAADERVYAMARDPDSVVRSAAVAALAELPTPTSKRLLRNALNDTDRRVQANAIEALDRLAAVVDEPLVQAKLYDDNNRTRANAVTALLKCGVREAAEALCAMLAEPDPEQRISALWVIGQMHLAPMLKRLRQLAASDPNADVREKAKRALDSLRGETKAPDAAQEVTPSAS